MSLPITMSTTTVLDWLWISLSAVEDDETTICTSSSAGGGMFRERWTIEVGAEITLGPEIVCGISRNLFKECGGVVVCWFVKLLTSSAADLSKSGDLRSTKNTLTRLSTIGRILEVYFSLRGYSRNPIVPRTSCLQHC